MHVHVLKKILSKKHTVKLIFRNSFSLYTYLILKKFVLIRSSNDISIIAISKILIWLTVCLIKCLAKKFFAELRIQLASIIINIFQSYQSWALFFRITYIFSHYQVCITRLRSINAYKVHYTCAFCCYHIPYTT